MSVCFTRVFPVAMLLLLGGCTVPPLTVQNTAGYQGATQAPPFHEAIEIGGRLSVRYQVDNKEESLHGSFIWSQTPSRTVVTLLSPLGQTIAVIEVNADGATLQQAGQPIRIAPDVDALTAATLGWPLPISGLREWLQGFTHDKAGKRFIATPAAARVVSDDGWHIHYASWIDENSMSPQNHPRRIDLARTTEQAGDVNIRIVIDTWQPR